VLIYLLHIRVYFVKDYCMSLWIITLRRLSVRRAHNRKNSRFPAGSFHPPAGRYRISGSIPRLSAQLASEHQIRKGGKLVWTKKEKGGSQNHLLDCLMLAEPCADALLAHVCAAAQSGEAGSKYAKARAA